MPDHGVGWRQVQVDGARADDRYAFIIDGSTRVPDPASRYQPEGVFGDSQLVDPDSFAWMHNEWRGRPWSEAVLWEAHVGAATPEGTFAGLRKKLDHLVDTGVTALQLMPIAQAPGSRTWGYDGVLPFAPNCAYGAPDDLKALVDEAHGKGLMVLLDVVYNHFGPSGNFLPAYADRFFNDRRHTPWGSAIDFDGAHSAFVRSFFLQNALFWISEYRFDGLRLDAVHAITDEGPEHFLDVLSQAVRARHPQRLVHLVLENEHNESAWLERGEDGAHLRYTAQWNDDFHHCWHVLLTGESEDYYGAFSHDPKAQLRRCLSQGFVFQGELSPSTGKPRGQNSARLPPEAFVSFLQNHDHIGNRAYGDRLTTIVDMTQLATARAVLLLSPQTPMLFMGEEWGSRTPFQYFVDFENDEALSKSVRDGRRREFAAFASYETEIPDPTLQSTFNGSRLDWSELSKDPYADILAETRSLLDLRRRYVAALAASGWRETTVEADEALRICWRFANGSLRLRLNLSNIPIHGNLDEDEEAVWQSVGCKRSEDVYVLAPWACVFTMCKA